MTTLANIFHPTVRCTSDILAAMHNTCAELLARQEYLKEQNNARARDITIKQDEIDAIEAECDEANDEIVYSCGVHDNIAKILNIDSAEIIESA